MNNRLEHEGPPAAGTRTVVEPIAAHWQDERLWLELVSDPNTRHWSVRVHGECGHSLRRHLGLEQALGVLACGVPGRIHPHGGRDT